MAIDLNIYGCRRTGTEKRTLAPPMKSSSSKECCALVSRSRGVPYQRRIDAVGRPGGRVVGGAEVGRTETNVVEVLQMTCVRSTSA